MKRCSQCKALQPLHEFYVNKATSDGKASSCKTCDRAKARIRAREYRKKPDYAANYKRYYRTWLMRQYGLTDTQYKDLLKKQSERCAICHSDARLVVDHCHKTGVVRGLLCRACNAGIGQLGDSVDTVRNALDYL